MKSIVVKTKKDEKLKGKVFTKNKAKGIMKRNYNPFEVNCKIYKRREGFYKMEDIELKEIKEGLNWKEKLIVYICKRTLKKVYKKGIEKGFNAKM